jgi:hypothetical protein
MVSLAELRARNVVPVWQEAVAVVQELIQTVKATTGSAELLPDLEHVALIPNGDVVALPGSPEPGSPVRHAAVMLKLLLEGVPAPPELEQFITRNVAEQPQFDNVAEFSRNLAFFERPGRRADVERLVGRAIAAEQTSRADEELRRLKERASEVTQAMPAPDFLQQPQKQVRTIPIPLVAVAGVAVIAAGLWIWTRVSQPGQPKPAEAVAQAVPPAAEPAASTPATATPTATPAPQQPSPATPAATGAAAPPDAAAASAANVPAAAAPPQPAPSFFARIGNAVRGAVAWVTGSGGADAPAHAAAPGTTEPAADSAAATTTAAPSASAPSATGTSAAARTTASRERPRRPNPVSPSPATPAVAETAVASAPAPAASAPAAMPAPPPVVPATADRFYDEAVEVFSASDVAVTPPVIVRPVLPKEPPPDVPLDEIGEVEVVVDENGDVLHVKLISPANRYRERMLVSASKMWKFRPAYKDGRPVRYKTRVRLTI